MWVKICGINDLATAREVARLRPDAIGLNFHPPSPRAVTLRTAASIAEAVRTFVEPVGVFVDQSVEKVVEACRACGFNTVQLHGDEPPEMVAALREALPNARIIHAERVGTQGLTNLAVYLEKCAHIRVTLEACLVDGRVKGAYGGTGQAPPWQVVGREYRRDEWPPLILAGGLHPGNVADAIATVRPWGVDVASGVEAAPGRKDLAAVERFIQAARTAFVAAALE